MAEDQLSEIELQILLSLERLGGSYHQRNLWKLIGIDSKMGLPVLNRLERKGYIVREKIVSGDLRGQYIVKLTEKAYELLSRLRSAELRDMADVARFPEPYRTLLTIPCTTCPYVDTCGVGEMTPITCELLNRWFAQQIRKG